VTDQPTMSVLRDESGVTRVVVADDHKIVLEGLVALLQDQPNMEVVGEATAGRSALEVIRKTRPDVALLDITMPELTGLEITRQLAEELPDVKVLVLTMHDEEAFLFEALQAGASGYILKGASSDELIFAIEEVVRGGAYITPQLAKGLVDQALHERSTAASAFEEPLTEREEEVLSLIAEGLTNKEIAGRMVVSLNTVKTHRLHLYQKLGLHTRSELVAFARQHGLTP